MYMLRVLADIVRFFGPFDTADAALAHGAMYCQDYRYTAVTVAEMLAESKKP